MNNGSDLMVVKEPIFNITPEFYKQFGFILNTILTPLVCIPGLIGNIVGLFILGKDPNKKKLTIYTYLISLMIFDIVYLILGLSVTATEAIAVFDYYLGNLVVETYGIYRGYKDIVLNHISSILLIFMSLERLMALMCPFTAKNSWLAKYPKLIVTVSSIVLAGYTIPFLTSLTLVPFSNFENRTEYAVRVRPGYVNMFQKFMFFETIILHFVAPLVVMILNILIAVAYSRFLKQRSNVKSSQTDAQKKITVVVLCVATLYVVLSIPNLIAKTFMFIDSDYSFVGRFKLTFFFFIYIGDLLARINAAIDFFIYIMVSSRYKSVFSEMIRDVACCRCTTKEAKQQSESPE